MGDVTRKIAKNVTINVNSNIDELTAKTERLVELMNEANSLIKELASTELEFKI
ncbi:MAG: hypothetical protein JJE03_06055 [Peptostreptococcaceae bacterium]|nr:hypothetical protein [Peptostreptococcaceae bacterium]